LTYSVADILGRPGEFRDIHVSEPLDGVSVSLARLNAAQPVRAELRAESVVEGILVTGRVEGQIVAICARCLTELPARVDLQVCELYTAPGNEFPEQEEAYEVEGTDIDLEQMLRDSMTLALPLHPVCSQDCKGICAKCGADLNGGPCDCTDEEIDPRWAALDALREKLES
jgi:uncharacterized protein